jgi:sugar transferase (PEP-CTERM/EpsH1 system associated)
MDRPGIYRQKSPVWEPIVRYSGQTACVLAVSRGSFGDLRPTPGRGAGRAFAPAPVYPRNEVFRLPGGSVVLPGGSVVEGRRPNPGPDRVEHYVREGRSARYMSMTVASSTPSHDVLRVMHVVFAFHPGGMELGVLKLVNGLDPRHVLSSVCSTRSARELAPLLAPHVPLFELHRRDGNDPRLVCDLYRLFRRERPHIVHTHAWGTLLEGLIAARFAGVPIVVHGEHGTLQLRRRQRVFQRYAWSRVDRVLSVSTRLAERMAHEIAFPPDRIQTIHNGVELSRFQARVTREDARRELGLPVDRPIVGAVGRLVPVKDHASLLEAIALLAREGLRPVAVIAGDGPLRDATRQRASALGIDADVRLLGHRTDIATVLAALDVFALTSRSEGLNNTILEAMAAGLPVVATRVGGADEMVIDRVTGLLVPAESPEKIAGALRRLLTDAPMRSAMGRASRARAETDFDLSKTVLKYERMYTELAQRSGCVTVPLHVDPVIEPGSPTARAWTGRTSWPS